MLLIYVIYILLYPILFHLEPFSTIVLMFSSISLSLRRVVLFDDEADRHCAWRCLPFMAAGFHSAMTQGSVPYLKLVLLFPVVRSRSTLLYYFEQDLVILPIDSLIFTPPCPVSESLWGPPQHLSNRYQTSSTLTDPTQSLQTTLKDKWL